MTPVVLSTRPAGYADPLVPALERAGMRCLAVPTVATVPVASPDEIAAALDRVADGGWVAVTSRRGALVALDGLARSGRDPGSLRWAAVAETTARTLGDGGVPEILLGPGTGTGLAAAIEPGRRLDGVTVLFPRADAASPQLPARLRERGADVIEIVAYRTVEGPEESRLPLREALADPDLAAVVFASGSAVRGLLTLGGPGAVETLARTAVVSIGRSTSWACRRRGVQVSAQAVEPTVPALVGAVASSVERSSRRSAS